MRSYSASPSRRQKYLDESATPPRFRGAVMLESTQRASFEKKERKGEFTPGRAWRPASNLAKPAGPFSAKPSSTTMDHYEYVVRAKAVSTLTQLHSSLEKLLYNLQHGGGCAYVEEAVLNTREEGATVGELHRLVDAVDRLRRMSLKFISNFLTKDEKRFIGMNTHKVQSDLERKTEYQYYKAHSKASERPNADEQCMAERPLDPPAVPAADPPKQRVAKAQDKRIPLRLVKEKPAVEAVPQATPSTQSVTTTEKPQPKHTEATKPPKPAADSGVPSRVSSRRSSSHEQQNSAVHQDERSVRSLEKHSEQRRPANSAQQRSSPPPEQQQQAMAHPSQQGKSEAYSHDPVAEVPQLPMPTQEQQIQVHSHPPASHQQAPQQQPQHVQRQPAQPEPPALQQQAPPQQSQPARPEVPQPKAPPQQQPQRNQPEPVQARHEPPAPAVQQKAPQQHQAPPQQQPQGAQPQPVQARHEPPAPAQQKAPPQQQQQAPPQQQPHAQPQPVQARHDSPTPAVQQKAPPQPPPPQQPQRAQPQPLQVRHEPPAPVQQKAPPQQQQQAPPQNLARPQPAPQQKASQQPQPQRTQPQPQTRNEPEKVERPRIALQLVKQPQQGSATSKAPAAPLQRPPSQQHEPSTDEGRQRPVIPRLSIPPRLPAASSDPFDPQVDATVTAGKQEPTGSAAASSGRPSSTSYAALVDRRKAVTVSDSDSDD